MLPKCVGDEREGVAKGEDMILEVTSAFAVPQFAVGEELAELLGDLADDCLLEDRKLDDEPVDEDCRVAR